MKKKTTKLLALLVGIVLVISLGVIAVATDSKSSEVKIVSSEDVPLKLWYDEEAGIMENENSPTVSVKDSSGTDVSWERWSLPIGNSYAGANVFGRTETERIQISEKTLRNTWSVSKNGVTYEVGGMNSFSETYIDFGHTNSAVTNYKRFLDLETAIAGVEYTYNGVKYTREHFVSYPDKAIVIRLDADTDGKLDFVLRPTIPYEQSYGGYKGDGITKSGTVTSSVNNGVGEIELAGNMGHYDIDFLGLYRVYTDGGSVEATTTQHTYKDKDGTSKTDTDGTITVKGANSAYIVLTLGSDYEISSEMFSAADNNKPTKNTTLADTRVKVGGYMTALESKISGKSYENAYKALKDTHVADHSNLFGRVALDLKCNSADYDLTTDKLLEKYQKGNASTYLETLMFQYGRYLLVASSRENTLPATLQGVWNTYNVPPWGSDYTHNINVQMNYWSAFSTNLAETFDAYVDYNANYMEKAQSLADEMVQQYNPEAYNQDGGNGWVMGQHTDAYKMTGTRSAGELGFTTQLFWEYYEYTKDPEVLKDVYRILVDAARYVTKCVELDEDGKYLVSYTDSPEMPVNGVWYYTTGTTYAQSFAYQNNYNALQAAKELGIDLTDNNLLSNEEYTILNTVMEQLDKYDPIHVGLSGQIKEFREETFYGSIGDEYNHRHTSQLVGLYPGNIINSSTPAWLDASKVSLNERGDQSTSWGVAFRLNMWARTKDGNRSHKLVQTLLKEDTGTNLWTLHPPFQIDGNFGITAGIAEMLLQSHEGYIQPLAAVPDAWSTGSYTGLVARGNFEVDAAWENGFATAFNITSRAGGTASVYCPSTKGVYVVTDNGTTVDYTKDGNIITFDTTKGETYVIAGFEDEGTQAAPTELGYDKTNAGAYDLSWKAPSGAMSYNVYVAINNDATYTLVGQTTATNFTYTPTDMDARITFAVTAVNANGVESERTLYYNNDPVQVEYGTIPGAKVGYPFALFIKSNEKNAQYTYVDSYAFFIDASNKAKNMMIAGTGAYKGGTAVIYMTRDCRATGDSFNNAGQVDGTLIVDLGNHALTVGVNRLIGFEAKAVNGLIDHMTRVEVKNGTLLTDTKPVAEVYSGSGFNYTGTKKFELLFEDVTFKKAEIATGGVSVLNSRGTFSSTKKAELKAEFVNCTFDYADQISAMTIINCSQGGEYAKCDVTVAGGTVKAPNLSTVTVFSGSTNDTFAYAKDENGNDTVFELAEGAGVATKYGIIPNDKLTNGQMFAVFAKKASDANYTFINTFGSMRGGALNNSRDLVKRNSGAYAGGTVVICMLKDYNYSVAANNSDNFNRGFQIDGTMLIDLGGYKLTIDDKPRLIGFETGGDDIIGSASGYNTVLKFVNGSIKADNPVVEVFGGSSTYTGAKSLEVNFEDIAFEPKSGTDARKIVISRNSFKSGQTVNMKLNYTNCTFNYASSGVVLYNDTATGDNSNPVVADVKVNGGNVKVADISKFTSRTDTTHDTVTFGQDANGARTTFTMNYAENAPSTAFTTDAGTMYLASEAITKEIVTGASKVTYSLSNVKAGNYGYVPVSKSGNAFSVFYNNLHVGSYANLNHSSTGALNAIKNLLYAGDGALKGKTVTIYTNKDYENDITTNRFDNYAQIDGNVVLDLGGHTITQAENTYLFNLVAKAVDSTKLPVVSTTVKNGKILTTSHEIMIVQSSGTTGNFGYEGTKTFNFTYENVTFDKHTSKKTYYAPLVKVDTFNDNGGKKNVVLNATFNNCTINSNDSILFNCATSNYVDVNATINGGSIKAQSMGENGLMKYSNTEDTVTLGKYNGEYVTLTLPKTAAAPTVKFNDQTLKFTLASESGSNSVYKLSHINESEELKAYSPKMSLTLDSTLKMNIYVPEYLTKTYVLDGQTEAYDSKVTLDDGKVYYKKAITLTSSDAIRDITLKVTVTVEGKDINGTFTFSVLQYATKTFASGKNIDKQLVRDVLSYIRASYKYFKPDNTDAVSKIDALIGAKYEEVTPFVPEEVIVNPTSFKAATFYLGDTPAFRFYLKDGDLASKYTFKIGGNDVKAIVGNDSNGEFLQITLYAYAMGDVIAYYADGVEVGSYHIANYYEWATTQNNDKLVNVVERFWAYCQSAKDYKNSVDVEIKYVDEDGNVLAPSYKETYKLGEEFSVLSPAVTGYYTRDVYKIASATSDTVFEVVYKEIPTNASASVIATKFPNIASWGDSITAGSNAYNITAANKYGIDLASMGSTAKGATYSEVLQNLIASRVYSGINVANCGVGGEPTSSIAARANTENYYLYLGTEVTVTSGPVVIDLKQMYPSSINPGRLGVLRKDVKDSLSYVTIVDGSTQIKGKLTCELVEGFVETSTSGKWNCDLKDLVYKFERTDGKTNAVTLSANARVIMNAAVDYDGRTCIVFMGENNGYSIAGTNPPQKDINILIAQQKEILKACGNPKNFLIISSTSGSTESRKEITEVLTKEWGDRYINMGNELNSSRKAYDFVGYSEAEIVSVQQNIIDGTVTTLLLNDTCHPHAVGYAAAGNFIFERMFKLGMFDELFDYYETLEKLPEPGTETPPYEDGGVWGQ